MSKVLESLVARGRRVRNFRESREITYGLADLSTNHDVHERLVKKGGVETLVNILILSIGMDDSIRHLIYNLALFKMKTER